MSAGPQKAVNPKVAAAVLIAAIAGVQWFWWKGLLSKPAPIRGGPMAMGGAMPAPVLTLYGDPRILVDTLAGGPAPGQVDGPGYRARFDTPTGIALAPDGTLLVADSRNHRIRKVTPTGVVTTLAGPDDLSFPCGVAVAPDGTVYVADTGNHRICRIASGKAIPIATGFDAPVGIALAPGPNPLLLVADMGKREILQLARDGAVRGRRPTAGAVLATATPLPRTLPLAGHGDLAPSLVVHRVTGQSAGQGATYLTADDHAGVLRLDGGKTTLLAGIAQAKGPSRAWADGTGSRSRFGRLAGLVADGKGHVYVCDAGNNAIRRLTLPATEQEQEREEAP